MTKSKIAAKPAPAPQPSAGTRDDDLTALFWDSFDKVLAGLRGWTAAETAHVTAANAAAALARPDDGGAGA